MADLTTVEGTLAYLEGTRFVAKDVQLLAGGRSAFVYRVILETPLDTGEKTIVLKHFEGYGALFRDTKAPIERAVRFTALADFIVLLTPPSLT
jgi:hypothetical protein